MILTKRSDISGILHSRTIDITENELDQYYKSDLFIQEFFPNLSSDDQEFIQTGIVPEEYDEMFAGRDDPDYSPWDQS